MSAENSADLPLAGIRVLDVASYIAAPVAATILADFGADVIKIEAPAGDGCRRLHTMPGMPASDRDYAWEVDNRSKRGLCLDLTHDEGRAILHKLVESADVFVTNLPGPARRKLGLTHADLAPLNRRLVYASLTAYGETGPEADTTGFDSTALWARTGLMDLVRPAPDATPTRSLPGMGDHPTGVSLMAAIAMGLLRRERTGEGGQVSTSLVSNGVWMNAFYAQAKLAGAEVTIRPHRDFATNALANHYRCADGRWFILALLNEERQAEPFFNAVERPELLADPRFADSASRRQNAQALTEILDAMFLQHDWAHWRACLSAHGITFGVVGKVDDLADDPQMRHAGAIVEMAADGPVSGPTIGSPVFMEGVEKRPPGAAPALGQHSREILTEIGYPAEEIDRLLGAGVVRQADETRPFAAEKGAPK